MMDSFLNVGGYSNSFWGWGGEDNDLYKKLSKLFVATKLLTPLPRSL